MVDIYELKWTQLENMIFRLLCVNAGKYLNQREIAKILKVSPTAVAKSLPKLEKDGLITVKKVGKVNLRQIGLNRDNQKVFQLKRAENLRLIYESGITEFLEGQLAGGNIILFGSYSNGGDTYTSDIDLAVIGRKEREIDLEEYEKMLERKININFYSSFKDIHKHLKDSILSGILISGVIDL